MKLYGYWRSSAAYRVRIALNIKGIDYENVSVHLVKNGGEQHSEAYQALNPAELVPTLQDGEVVLNQSLAILDYLESKAVGAALLPNDVVLACQIRAFCLDIACDIHPLNNLRVLQHLGKLGHDEETKNQWYRHWLHVGFTALEKRLQQTAGQYCFGDMLTLADVCLAPQVYNAKRYQLDMTPFPLIQAVNERLNLLPAFIAAQPENQPDAV